MKKRIQVVVGGQFGSEGKGAIAGFLAKDQLNLLAIRVGGPNAGHTAYDDNGKRWPLRQLPVAALTNPTATLAIAAGSEVDFDVLVGEVRGTERRVVVDPQATVLTEEHALREKERDIQGRIGSTAKGIGVAREDRIRRVAWTVGQYADAHGLPEGVELGDVSQMAQRWESDVMVEGTQGFGLGLHAGYYPYCTSIDCRAIDMLALAGIDPQWGELETWLVIRTYPIRVAGNSGPLPFETTWEKLAERTSGYIQPEKTTVTQKVRRVAMFDPAMVVRAINANGGADNVHLALTMLDYVFPDVRGWTRLTPENGLPYKWLDDWGWSWDSDHHPFELLGTSPQTVIDWRQGWATKPKSD